MLRPPFFIKPVLAWGVSVGLIIGTFFLPLCAPILHESDQASLLYGAVEIDQSGKLTDRGFYNYDKQYGSYWLLALVFKACNVGGNADAVVLTGNLLSIFFILGGLLLMGRFVVLWNQFIFLTCVVLAPSLLMHGPFLATNYLSAGFLCAQFFFMRAKRGKILVPIFAFCAVACRADAVLLQPLIFWGCAPELRVATWLKSRLLWITAIFCIAAVALGKAIDFKISPSFLPFFDARIFAVYTIFGLGSGALVVILTCTAFYKAIFNGRGGRVFKVCGLLCFILPFFFYGIQMYSTRHWTLALFAAIFLYCSPNGIAIMTQFWNSIRGKTLIIGTLLVCAIFPLFIGIRMPLYPRFDLTFTCPTLYPTADGLQPMGAYLAQTWGWDRKDRLIPDHNQAIWLAAKNSTYLSTPEGMVPLLGGTLMRPILQLAVAIQKQEVTFLAFSDLKDYGFAYTDNRYLRRGDISFDGRIMDSGKITDSYNMVAVSPNIEGESIEMVLRGENERYLILKALREQFAHNDFTIKEDILSKSDIELPDCAGHLLVLLSEESFSVATPDGALLSSQPANGGKWSILEIPKGSQRGYKLYGNSEGQRYVMAISKLPSYMHIKSYRNNK